MKRTAKALLGLLSGFVTAGLVVLIRLVLGMPLLGTVPIIVVGVVAALFTFAAASLGLKRMLSRFMRCTSSAVSC